jgi:hypothetical protein
MGIDIATFKPDIVVSAASEAFSMPGGLLQEIEANWDVIANGTKRPFYVLSPYNAGDLGTVEFMINGQIEAATDINAQQRFVGISIAGAEDLTLQTGYESRLRSHFKDAYTDTANYYDAVYFLAYAMYGSSDSGPLSGPGIADGMKRLLAGDSSFDIGPAPIIPKVFDALAEPGSNIEVRSTMGPPSFDPDTGVRSVDASVLCFQKDGTTVTRQLDVLRYDRKLSKFRGAFPCFTGLFP